MAIPKKNLPAGIMHITVFDKNLIPLAERLVFISNYELPAISITTDSLSFLARGKNKLKFDFSKFSTPNVSIAITDAETTALPHTENNILSNLLLTSDLKGHIYQPGYYFQNKEAATLEQLDLLMLTHGWRRFRWDNVFNNKDIALKYPVESGISVSGIVTIPESKKTIAGGHVDILTKGEDSSTILSKALVNANGEFMIDDLNFKQMATVYLQGSKSSNKNANVDIILNKSYIDTLRFSENKPQIDLDTFSSVNQMNNKLFAVIAEEKERNKVVTLSEVKVTAKKISRIDSLNTNYASDLFRSGQSLEITSQHYLSIWQFLRDQVNGLVVEGDIMNPSVYFRRFAGMNLPSIADEESANQSGGIEVNGITYFLNEINVSKDVISALQPSDIALVKVFKGPEGAVLGVNEGGIAIYTKKGQTGTKRPAEKGFFTERKIGYAVSREFFNPDYSVTWDSSFKDNRTTLYWNPNIRTDKNGNATIRFFNNDITKKYKITIQGIDKKGDILFIDKVLQ